MSTPALTQSPSTGVARARDVAGGAGGPSLPGVLTRGQLTALLGLTLLAAVLRLWRLGEWSFWVDEAHTFRDATSDLDAFWGSHVSRYPLSFLMLRGMIGLDLLPSTSEGWLRLPFAFFGILSVPALALFGRSLCGTRAALIAALFLALSPWHIYWSQNARSYSMMMFFCLCAAAGFYHGIVRHSVVAIVLASLAALLSGLSHPTGFLVLAVLAAFGMVETRKKLWRPGSAMRRFWPVLTLLLLAGFVTLLLPALTHASLAKPDLSVRHLVSTFAYFIGPPMILTAGGGLLVLLGRGHRPALFLGCWALLPLFCLGLISVAVTKVTAQYAFCVLPAFCLLAGVMVDGTMAAFAGPGWRNLGLRLVLPAVVLGELCSYDFLYYSRQYGDRPRWREAAQYVTRDPERKTLLLTTNEKGINYYTRRGSFWGETITDPDVVSIESWDFDKAGGTVPYLHQHLRRAVAEERDMYVLVTEPELYEKDTTDTFNQWLRDHGHQVERYPAWTGPKDMTVLVYLVPPTALPPEPVDGAEPGQPRDEDRDADEDPADGARDKAGGQDAGSRPRAPR